MRDVGSPDSFINMGFYFMVAACLQRRVWTSSNERPLFPNPYYVLCGPPGIGKGMVLKPIEKMLKSFRTEGAPKSIDDANDAQYMAVPVAASSITYEQLTRVMAKSVRRINYDKVDEQGRKALGIYTHASLCFCLEEMSSLFRKKAEDVAKFLLVAFDSGDYDYETKNNGQDRIRKCCLALIGGTTPSFMEQSFNDAILTDGWSSRTIFIYEHFNRFDEMFIPESTPEQAEARDRVQKHLEKLTHLYGFVDFSDDAKVFLETWWAEIGLPAKYAAEPKMQHYFARKKAHILKLCMAIHFSECPRIEPMTVATAERAIAILADLEKRMPNALSAGVKNPLAIVQKKIVEILSKAPEYMKTYSELWKMLNEDARELELKEAIRTLVAHKKIETVIKNSEIHHRLTALGATDLVKRKV